MYLTTFAGLPGLLQRNPIKSKLRFAPVNLVFGKMHLFSAINASLDNKQHNIIEIEEITPQDIVYWEGRSVRSNQNLGLIKVQLKNSMFY